MKKLMNPCPLTENPHPRDTWIEGMKPNSGKRKTKKWWTFYGGTVLQVTGYSCAPENPSHWWCPQVGYTLDEDYHLYDNERDAVEGCIDETNCEINDHEMALDKLTKRLGKL